MRGGQLDSVNSLFQVAELLDQYQEVLDTPNGSNILPQILKELNFNLGIYLEKLPEYQIQQYTTIIKQVVMLYLFIPGIDLWYFPKSLRNSEYHKVLKNAKSNEEILP